MTYDVIIVGAGAAGLYLGAHLDGVNAIILEKNNRPGIKVLASGSGQCNLTHSGYISAFYERYGDHKSFVKPALKAHDNKAVIAYFESLGLKTMAREDGKVFPASLKAKDVVMTLMHQVQQIRYQSNVKSIEQIENGFNISLETGEMFKAKHVIIATGGKSYPTMGSTGDGYSLAQTLGHSIVPPKPGLTGVVTREKTLLALQGQSFKNTVVACNGPNTNRHIKGDLLITHFGLSGPVILNHSRWLYPGDQLKVNFLGKAQEIVEKEFLEAVNHNGEKPLAFWLNQLEITDAFKNFIVDALEKEMSIQGLAQMKLGNIDKRLRKRLLSLLLAYPLEIENLIGYQQAMVTVGGVCLEEVSSKTMMSKNVENLYFIGEVLDIDGDTGGYNLQWAFSSAVAAASDIKKKIQTY